MPNLDKALDFAGIRYYLSVAGESLLPDDAASKADLERVRKLASKAFHFNGSVPNFESLPKTGNQVGDVWNIGGTLDGVNVAWTGSGWDSMGTFAPLAGLVPAGKTPPLEAAEDYRKLQTSPAVANYAKRLQVDTMLDKGRDGEEIALLNAAATICVKSMDSRPLVMCSGSSYASSATFYIPIESVAAGVPVSIRIVGRPPVPWNGTGYNVWSDDVRLSVADASAADFTPPASVPEDNVVIKTFSGLQLVDPKTGTVFGTVGGTYRKVIGRPMYSLSLSWTGGSLYMWAGREDGGPMGVNFSNLRPGAPKTVAIDAAYEAQGAPHAGVSAYFFPTAGVPKFVKGTASPDGGASAGLVADIGDMTAFPLKGSCQSSFDIPIAETWDEEDAGAQHGPVGRLSAVWARVDDLRCFASIVWTMPGMFAERPMTLSVHYGDGTEDPVLAEQDFSIHPYAPSIVSFSTAGQDVSGGEPLFLEMSASPSSGSHPAELNPDAAGVSVDGTELTGLTANDCYNGLIPRVNGRQMPTDEWGTFSVRWTRLNEVLNEAGTAVIGHDYTCSVVWMPPVPHAWRTLRNAKAKEKIDELLGPDDFVTSETNGIVSWTDKFKLDGITSGANVTAIPDPETGVRTVKVDGAISASSVNPVQTVAVFNELKDKITRDDVAEPSVDGVGGRAGTLPAADKAKLDKLDPDAGHTDVDTLPVGGSDTMGVVKVDASVKSASVNPVRNAAVFNALKSKITRDDVAVPSVNGAGGSAGTLPAADKGKLDGIESGANYTTLDNLPKGGVSSMGVVKVDGGINGISLNPVQTVKVTSAVSKLQSDAASAGETFDGDGLVTRGTSQIVSGAKTFESAVIGNLTGDAVYASRAFSARTAAVAEELSPSRKIILSGALAGSAIFSGTPVTIGATLNGGVPPATPSESGCLLMAGSNGALEWNSPGMDKYLAKNGEQTVATEKDFKGDGSADNGMLTADPVYSVISSAASPKDEVFGVNPGQALSWAHANYIIKDKLRAEVEHRTEGRNTIIRGADGSVHVMVVIKKFNCSIFPPGWGLGSDVHPAFQVGDREVPEILIGKYLASVPPCNKADPEKFKTVRNGAPYASFVSPYGSNGITAQIAKTAGKGFQLNTIFNWGAAALQGLAARVRYEWQVISSGDSPPESPYNYRGEVTSVDALPSSGASPYDCYKIEGSDPAVYYAYVPNGDFPGNLYYGRCLVDDKGVPVADQTTVSSGTIEQAGIRCDLTYAVPGVAGANSDPATLTGTGPVFWTHDGTQYGICDMVGNRAEIVLGFGNANSSPTGAIRLPANNAAMDAGEIASGPATVLCADGEVRAASESSSHSPVYLKYSNGGYFLTTVGGAYSPSKGDFSGIQIASDSADVSAAAMFLRRLGIFPVKGLTGGGQVYIARGNVASVAMFMGGCGNPALNLCRGGLFSFCYANSVTEGTATARGIRLAYLP